MGKVVAAMGWLEAARAVATKVREAAVGWRA